MPRHEVRYAHEIEGDIAQTLLEYRPWQAITSAWEAAVEHLAVNPELCKEKALEEGTFACFEAPIWIQFKHYPLDMRVMIVHVSLAEPLSSAEAE